jgi:hypothetical protein
MGTFAGTAIVDESLSFADQENNLPFTVAVFNIFIYIYIYIYMLGKTEALAIFLNPFTFCLPCKCPFVDEETNGLNGIAHPQYIKGSTIIDS